jgi:integrase
MASLRKREYKSGKVTWVIDYYKGKKHLMKTIGSCDKRTAEKIFHKFVADQSKSDVGIMELKKSTLATLKDEYLKYSISTKAVRSVEREELVLKTFLKYVGDITISDITIADIQNYRNYRLRSISPETINLEFRHLKAIFNWAIERNYLSNSVFNKVKPIRVPESELPKFFEVEEINKVREKFNADPFKWIVEFYLLTGARLKEALVLSWNHIDEKREVITIPSTGTKAKKHRRISYAQDTQLKKLLKEIPRREDNLLFGPAKGDQWSSWWVSRKISKMLSKIGLPWASCHTFRHTYISHLVMNGVPLTTVKEIVGHSSFTTTLRYAHLSTSHKDQMASRRSY